MTALPLPAPGDAVRWVTEHLDGLFGDEPRASVRFRGGQHAADAALAGFDVTGYAARRNQVHPPERRGASALSPWIRHGLLPLPEVWDHVGGGPARDVRKFRDELLWQEYARHWYARLGHRTRQSVRAEPDVRHPTHAWDRSLVCIDEVVGELERDGWAVNQTRMWMASHWSVRHRADWRAGEDELFRHLLDGSRAANRLGWQWTTGAGSSKPYGFSRWQVEKRAPAWCRRCPHRTACPIQDWPDEAGHSPVPRPDVLAADPDPDTTAGPEVPVAPGTADTVWLTAESLGDADPASAVDHHRPAVFVFDEPLLVRLQLSAKRLVFLAETLAELAEARPLELHRGAPARVLRGRSLAVTFAPTPGYRRLRRALEPAEEHPWPWLRRPRAGSVASFSAWRRSVDRV